VTPCYPLSPLHFCNGERGFPRDRPSPRGPNRRSTQNRCRRRDGNTSGRSLPASDSLLPLTLSPYARKRYGERGQKCVALRPHRVKNRSSHWPFAIGLCGRSFCRIERTHKQAPARRRVCYSSPSRRVHDRLITPHARGFIKRPRHDCHFSGAGALSQLGNAVINLRTCAHETCAAIAFHPRFLCI
jgi:hypothetical protein